MWESDYKENWVAKNWCFRTVVLEKTLESPLDCKEIQPVNPKGNQSWIFIGRTDGQAETPILWPSDEKNWLMEKTLMLGKVEGRRRGRQRMRWLDGFIDLMDMSEQVLGVEQGNPVCCSPWGRKGLNMTGRLNWIGFIFLQYLVHRFCLQGRFCMESSIRPIFGPYKMKSVKFIIKCVK